MGFLESGPLQTNEGLKKEIYCRKNGTTKDVPPALAKISCTEVLFEVDMLKVNLLKIEE
jgi:hypothetical protein